jgi:hypothetical protein
MPDGQNILYTAAWDGGTPKIYSTRFDSTESSELPLDNAEVLSISARGELALLTKVVGGGAFNEMGTLATAPSTGSAPRELYADVTFADWSPDGSELALIASTQQGYVLEYPLGCFPDRTVFGQEGALAPDHDFRGSHGPHQLWPSVPER